MTDEIKIPLKKGNPLFGDAREGYLLATLPDPEKHKPGDRLIIEGQCFTLVEGAWVAD